MAPLDVGAIAPEVPGITFGEGPTGLFFFKVTCPTCQLAAPTMEAFERHFPGRVVGVGQDPVPALERFAATYGMGIRLVEDPPPYAVSAAYDLDSVPTLVLVGADGRVIDTIGAWDRDGFNRIAATLAAASGLDPVVVSSPDDGRPAFKPG